MNGSGSRPRCTADGARAAIRAKPDAAAGLSGAGVNLVVGDAHRRVLSDRQLPSTIHDRGQLLGSRAERRGLPVREERRQARSRDDRDNGHDYLASRARVNPESQARDTDGIPGLSSSLGPYLLTVTLGIAGSPGGNPYATKTPGQVLDLTWVTES